MDKFLGRKCRDKITGIEGVCTSKIRYIYGCDQYTMEMIDKNKVINTYNIDEGRLAVVEDAIDFEHLTDQEKQAIFGIKGDTCSKYLGKLCMDKISGFKGACTAYIIDLYQPGGLALTPKAEQADNVGATPLVFNIERIEIIEEGTVSEEVQVEKHDGFHSMEELELSMAADGKVYVPL